MDMGMGTPQRSPMDTPQRSPTATAARRIASPCMMSPVRGEGKLVQDRSSPSLNVPQQRAVAGTGLEAMRGGPQFEQACAQQRELQPRELQPRELQPRADIACPQQREPHPREDCFRAPLQPPADNLSASGRVSTPGRVPVPISPSRNLMGTCVSNPEGSLSDFEMKICSSLNGRFADLEQKLSRSYDAEIATCRKLCTGAIMDFRQELRDLRACISRQDEVLEASQDDTALNVIRHDVRELRMALAAVCTDVEKVQHQVTDGIDRLRAQNDTCFRDMDELCKQSEMLRVQNDSCFSNMDQLCKESEELREQLLLALNEAREKVASDITSLRGDMYELQKLQLDSGNAIEAVVEQQSKIENQHLSEQEALRKEQTSAMYVIQGQLKKESDAIMSEVNALEASRLRTLQDVTSLQDMCVQCKDDMTSQHKDQGDAIAELRKQYNNLSLAIQYQSDSRKAEVESLKKLQSDETDQKLIVRALETMCGELKKDFDELRADRDPHGARGADGVPADVLDRLRSEHNRAIESVKAQHSTFIQLMQDQHSRDLEDLRLDLTSQIVEALRSQQLSLDELAQSNKTCPTEGASRMECDMHSDYKMTQSQLRQIGEEMEILRQQQDSLVAGIQLQHMQDIEGVRAELRRVLTQNSSKETKITFDTPRTGCTSTASPVRSTDTCSDKEKCEFTMVVGDSRVTMA